jgi:hypothetical protein
MSGKIWKGVNGRPRRLCSGEQLVMKDQQLARMERGTSISPAFAVAEFDLEHTGCQIFDHRTYLSADELLSGYIFQKRHNI